MKKTVSLMLALFLAVSMTGLAFAEAPANLAEDQTLRVSIGVDLTDLNPLTESTAEGSDLLLTSLETLVRQKANGLIEMGSGLAESWDVSEDGLTYVFHLRDAQFSNGAPITAPDFEYTWKKVLDPATASEYAYMLYTIEGAEAYNSGAGDADSVAIKALDDKTLEVKLTGAYDYFIGTLVIPQFSVVPAGYQEECGDDFFMDVDHMIFSGPFKITDWTPSQSITVEKNPYYWDADSVILDKIIFDMTAESNTIVNMYTTDMLDVIQVQPNYLDMFRGEKGFISVTEPVTEYLMFNNANEYFANLHIRRAFSMALNRVEYMTSFMRSGSSPAYGFIPGGIKGTDGKDFRENNGELYTDVGNGNTAEEALAELQLGLAELGKTIDDLKGAGLSLVIGTGDANLLTAQVFQQYWKTVLGLDVEVNSLAYAMRQEQYGGNYTLGKEGWGADYNDALSFLELFISTSPYNKIGYNNPEFDELLAKANQHHGDERLAYLQEAEKVLVQKDQAIAPTFFQTRSWVAKDHVAGIIRNGCGQRCEYKYAYITK